MRIKIAEHIPMMVADGVGMVWASIRQEDKRIDIGKRMLGEKIGPGQSKYTEYDAAVTKCAVDWLKDKTTNSEPWCLFIGLVAPHFPLVVPEQFYNLYPLESLPEVKLHPSSGYIRHPWVEKQNAFMDSESKFVNAEERLAAMASYYGLCSWLDHNVGEILGALDAADLTDNTSVIYTSDHGDNVGARGLWGKSNMYEESCAVPLIASGAGFTPGATCDTPVSLLDLSATIARHFDTHIESDDKAGDPVGKDLAAIASQAVSGAFMIRRGDWKYIHYEGFEPELFNLKDDPEELENLAADPSARSVRDALHQALISICDPSETDAMAHRDQHDMIERYGGFDMATKMGAPGATPPPKH